MPKRRFRPRELGQSIDHDDLRRQLNQIQVDIDRDLDTLFAGARLTEVITASTYAAAFGEVSRFAPPTGGTRLILPEPNPAALGLRVTAVIEAASGALSVEVINGTINGAATLSYIAGIGTVEFILTPTGWYGWSISLIDLATLAGAGLTHSAGVLAVGAGTGITVNANDVAVTIPLTDGDKGDITVASGGTAWTLDNATVTPAKLAVIASNAGPVFAAYVAFAAAAAGSADDVTIFSSNVPVALTVLHILVRVSTAIGGSTLTVRTAIGGGGTAFTDAMSSAATGTVHSNAATVHTSAAGSSLFLRRSDRGVAGEVVIFAIRS